MRTAYANQPPALLWGGTWTLLWVQCVFGGHKHTSSLNHTVWLRGAEMVVSCYLQTQEVS